MHQRTAPNIIKSIGIVLYLSFVVFAGIVNLMGYPWARKTHPWFHYNMFSGGKTQHIEIAVEKRTVDGMLVPFSLKSTFPMSPLWTERGYGRGILTSLFNGFPRASRGRFMKKLCRYILRQERKNVNTKEIRIYQKTWPLTTGKSAAISTVLTSCL